MAGTAAYFSRNNSFTQSEYTTTLTLTDSGNSQKISLTCPRGAGKTSEKYSWHSRFSPSETSAWYWLQYGPKENLPWEIKWLNYGLEWIFLKICLVLGNFHVNIKTPYQYKWWVLQKNVVSYIDNTTNYLWMQGIMAAINANISEHPCLEKRLFGQ